MKTNLSYKNAGVDIEKGNELVSKIKTLAAKTHRPGILSSIGGFGALFELPLEKYKQPVLVSSTDGVGTKLKLAIELKKHDTIGIDLVAMCVNDIIVQGAEPLFFLDYFATGHLSVDQGEEIITGITNGCLEAGVALAGGETAEMPGMYQNADYDLAGFVVGIVDKTNIITGQQVKAGDILLALPSSGLHSNGYSLVRKILAANKISLDTSFENETLGDTLLTPTRIYVKTILELLRSIPVNAIAHITGGGIVENLPRVLPNFTQAIIRHKSWETPEIFNWLQAEGNISLLEMFKTFNCGVGMIICIDRSSYTQAIDILESLNEQPWVIGEIQNSPDKKPTVIVDAH